MVKSHCYNNDVIIMPIAYAETTSCMETSQKPVVIVETLQESINTIELANQHDIMLI